MIDTYLAICEIDYYNEDADTTETEHVAITNVANYADAVSRAEAYYGEDICGIRVTLLDGPFCPLNENMVDLIMRDVVNAEENL